MKPSVNLRLTQTGSFPWLVPLILFCSHLLPPWPHSLTHSLTWPLSLSLWHSCPKACRQPAWLLRVCTRDHESCRTFQTPVKNTNYVIINWAHLHIRIISSFKTSNFKKCWFPAKSLSALISDHFVEASLKTFWLDNHLFNHLHSPRPFPHYLPLVLDSL